MAPLLTTGQSRWALHFVLAILSATAIASSAPPSAGSIKMLHGNPGDLRGVQLVAGGAGLVVVLICRTSYLVLRKPWRVYLDRFEFALISSLWIIWTSATMAFSAFTIHEGVCSTSYSELYLPTCPLLTFDLFLLHLLSITNLALLLVILSTALSPNYYLSNSTSLEIDEEGGKADPESTDVFLMWDFVLDSPPQLPVEAQNSPLLPSSSKFYGAVPATPKRARAYSQPSPEQTTPRSSVPAKKDKFADGRLRSYVPLLLGSIGAGGASVLSLARSKSRYTSVNVFIIVVAGLSCAFASGFLIRHLRQARGKLSTEHKSTNVRQDRAIEFSFAGALFLLWPLAAIIITLFPPTANRPCTNPAASFDSSDDLPLKAVNVLCISTSTTVALSWLASWIILFRVMGLVVPIPEMSPVAAPSRGPGEESRSLLRSSPVERIRVERPQVKWGRIIAGEAFELGDDGDEE